MKEQVRVSSALMLRELAFVMRASRALYAAAELGLADILANGAMTSAEVGAAAGVDVPTMRRLMRALVAHGVFEEPDFDRSLSMHRPTSSGATFRVPSTLRSCSRRETCGGSFGRTFSNP